MSVVPFLALGAIGPGASAAVAAPTHVPKVVVIVGPAGDATDGYRAAGAAAVEAARAYTPDVVEIASPNATWPIVRSALQGASVVVYLGHGNGWPSRYRSSLYPPSQDGLGLNPVAGVDDVAHQYFGEAFLERDIHLAPNAVVVLSHLCYASGNSEPGLPEGTLDVARQRVDNFAAGWIAAGANAVVAEAYMDPAYYVRSVLSGHGSVTGAWDASPTFHANVLRFASVRRPGFVDLLDPIASGGPGFTRSLVVRGSVSSADVVGSGLGSSNADGNALPPTPTLPTLASVGAVVAAPTLSGLPIAGARRTLTLPIALPKGAPLSLLRGLELAVRWDRLDVPVPAAPPAQVVPPPAQAVPPTAPSPGASAPGAAGATATPSSSASPAPPPDPFALVVAETQGDVVDPVPARAGATGWRIPASLPDTPGLYALAVELHGSDGVAFDPASQALVPRLLVRVVGQRSATIVAPASIEAPAGATFALPVGIRNSGVGPWAAPQPVGARPGSGVDPVGPIVVTAHWVPLGSGAASGAATTSNGGTASGPASAGGSATDGRVTDGSAAIFREVEPGEQFAVSIPLAAPDAAGSSWLLVLDVATPETPSLVAAGSAPAFVRVDVRPAVATTPGSGARS